MSDENLVKLYFGRKPEGSMSIDDLFIGFMKNKNYLIDEAVEELIHALKTLNLSTNVFHTLNPLILNFMDDDVAKELVWMIDEDDNHIHMGTDKHLLKMLEWMGPGEAICNDVRSFYALPVKDISNDK